MSRSERTYRSLPCLVVCLCSLVVLTAPSFAAIFEVSDVGPYFTIQSAVDDAVVAPGGTVLIHPGIYNENVVMSGAHAVHLVAADVPDQVGAAPTGVGAPPFSGGVVINGDTVGDDGIPDGPCLTITNSNRASVTDITLTNCLGEGIFLGIGADFVKLHHNTLYGIVGVGIGAFGAEGVNITSNWITQTQQDGIRLANVNTAHIADNVLEGSSVTGSTGVRIGGGSQHIQLVNNEIRTFMGEGIQDSGFKTRMERNTLEGNCASGGGCGVCFCRQALTCPGSVEADFVGNRTFPPGNWAFCGAAGAAAGNL